MRISDLPEIDFISCDACRAPFDRAHSTMVMGIEKPSEGELILGLCANCMGILSGSNREAADDISRKAEATARLRPNRIRKPNT
jgi:hypothetical protein